MVKSSSFTNLIKDLKDKRAQTRREIQYLIGLFDPLTSSATTFSGKVRHLTHEIKNLTEEEDKRALNLLELQCYFAQIIDFMQRNVKEAKILISAPDYKSVDEMEDFVIVLHGHFNTMK